MDTAHSGPSSMGNTAGQLGHHLWVELRKTQREGRTHKNTNMEIRPMQDMLQSHKGERDGAKGAREWAHQLKI